MNIKDIKGVGVQLEKKLNNLNIYNVQDLLEHYPYRYNFINIININEINNDESCMIKATIVEEGKVQYIKKNFNRLNFKCVSDNIVLNVTIFNRAFLKNNLVIGKEIILVGKYHKLKNSFLASDIKFNIENNSIEPIYHLSNGLKNSNIIKLLDEVLNYNCYYDLIPKEYIDKYNFINKDIALKYIHKPKNINEIKLAKVRLKYEELFEFMFKINYLKKMNSKAKGIKR